VAHGLAVRGNYSSRTGNLTRKELLARAPQPLASVLYETGRFTRAECSGGRASISSSTWGIHAPDLGCATAGPLVGTLRLDKRPEALRAPSATHGGARADTRHAATDK